MADHLKTPKVQRAVENVGDIMANQLAKQFTSDMLLTVIARCPTNPEADFFMSSEGGTLADLRALLDRCEKREKLEHESRQRP
jgi:hypothetical protein